MGDIAEAVAYSLTVFVGGLILVAVAGMIVDFTQRSRR